MTTLREHLDDYLAIRRAVGFKLERSQLLLTDFVGYLESEGLTMITVDAAMVWAAFPPNGVSGWHAHRLSVVRGFARHLHVIDPAHQVPPTGVFPTPKHRATPFLYSDADIEALMAAARTFRSPLRTATLETVVGLLAVTGLRIGGSAKRSVSTAAISTLTMVSWGLRTRSSTSPAWFRSTRARSMLWPPTRRCVTGSARCRLTRRCSCRSRGLGCVTTTSIRLGSRWSNTPGSRPARRSVGPDHTTCVTLSPFGLCLAGIAAVKMSPLPCRDSRRSSVTSTRPIPTGI